MTIEHSPETRAHGSPRSSLRRRRHAFTLLLGGVTLLGGAALLGCRAERAPTREEAPAVDTPKPGSGPAPAVDTPKPETNAGDEAKSAPKSVASDPAPPAAQRRYVVAALGDSITDGRVGGGGYLKELARLCPKSQFLDFGKGGDMTNQMRRRLELDVLPQARALGLTTLLVYGGVNDLYSDLTAGRTNPRIEEDLTTIYRRAREAGLEVVAFTVSPWGGFTRYANPRRAQNTRLLNSWILGQVEGGLVRAAVDTYPILSCGDPEVLCPDYETRGHDGLHPGPAGHELLGRAAFESAFSDCQ